MYQKLLNNKMHSMDLTHNSNQSQKLTLLKNLSKTLKKQHSKWKVETKIGMWQKITITLYQNHLKIIITIMKKSQKAQKKVDKN